MVKLTPDTVTLESNSGNGKKLKIEALGGPADSVLITMELDNRKLGMEVGHDDLDKLQTSIINFFNTGYFNKES